MYLNIRDLLGYEKVLLSVKSLEVIETWLATEKVVEDTQPIEWGLFKKDINNFDWKLALERERPHENNFILELLSLEPQKPIIYLTYEDAGNWDYPKEHYLINRSFERIKGERFFDIRRLPDTSPSEIFELLSDPN